MTNNGGQQNDPTSYDLRPPQQPPPPRQGEPSPAGQYGYPPAPRPPEPAGPNPYATPAPPAAGPGAGRVVGGRYRLDDRLGHGGMGTVWRGFDLVVHRAVAVKEPRLPDQLSEAERENAYQRMHREARAAARIEHPAVVTVHDVVVEEGRPWVVMELVTGHSLGDRLQDGTLDVREAARIGLAVLGALEAAHEAGVLHRDVKPDNVLLGKGDRVVLTDFGIAQVEGEQGLTETGAFVGSPEFIAPERVLGQQPGPASDLWSLGVVLYAAVEGVSPFRRSHTPATLQAVLSADPATPSRASGALGQVIMQLLRKDPAFRPGPAEVRQALTALAQPAAAPATRLLGSGPGTSQWLPPAMQRSPKAKYGVLGGLVAVVLVLVLIAVNPFGGGLPEDWVSRPEAETVAADISVPKEYKRSASDSDDTSVRFEDPSGVFFVYVERVDRKEKTSSLDEKPLAPSASAWKRYYERGGSDESEIEEAKVTTAAVEHQGRRDSFETVVDHYRYGEADDEDALRRRYHELVVPGEDQVYWRLRVGMPGAGKALDDGEELFRTITENFTVQL
ncbi:serine/threonine protein kinase [Streptomyces albidoflavus]|uniref:serine/threonine-protein kinase n=1 Tax=Streptomyces albidoflavus TaxID=1886 RepID=UPI00101E3922|nr:serine/threonine-protein kinase [Streptomyces albidoflavus]RZD60270.1 serine/threonine protein kinase [Streptomyces albidoflavus]